jgi:hypothetical protein
LLGHYLRWCFDHIREIAPAGINIENHRSEAIGIERHGKSFVIRPRGEDPISADYVFVATGHASGRISAADECTLAKIDGLRCHNPHIGFIPSAAAFSQLETIGSGAKVLICGTGLSAADALSMLTAGRGGRFEPAGQRRLHYVPSGLEPRVTLYSRQGLPSGAKGLNQKALGDEYEATCFTQAFIDEKRRKCGQLHWERDILPCLIREMEACWKATVKREVGPDASEPDPQQVRSSIRKLLHPWDGVTIRSREEHREFVLAHLAQDIDAAFCGNVSHPTKAVAEMLRDLNDVVRDAVNYCSLDESSHRSFLGNWVPISNRLASGPPKERNMQLLALMEAGIVDIFEPKPDIALDSERGYYKALSMRFGYQHEECFDVLVRARIAPFNLESSPSPFFSSGKEEGIFTPFRNGSFAPGGIAIDRSLNVLDAHGRPNKAIWAMGYAVEGANYYTNVLPCPLSNSCSLRDAATAAKEMLDEVTSNAGATMENGDKVDNSVMTGSNPFRVAYKV